MNRQEAISKLETIKTTFTIIGIIILLIGAFKVFVYNNPDGDTYKYNDDETEINAYVGGDAYNLIINGTYFTACAVMGTGSLIIATIAGVAEMFMSVVDSEEKKNLSNGGKKSMLEDIESNLPQM